MKKYYNIIFMVFVMSYLWATPPEVFGVVATPGSGQVVITYTLVAEAECRIIILASADDGMTYNIYPTAITGDVGNSVISGHKQIIWRPAADSMEVGLTYKVKIIARDNPLDVDDPDYEQHFDSFVKIIGGTFTGLFSLDATISDFYLSKYELTQGEYEAVMGINPSANIVTDQPVERVSWFNAVKYCNIRSMQEGLMPCYDYNNEGTDPNYWSSGWDNDDNHENYSFDFHANGYRLPTASEWMYAAKGGNLQPATGYNEWSGTNDESELTNYAWYTVNSGTSGNKQVGTRQPNQLGLYDMSGNIIEWVWDIAGYYSDIPEVDPIGASSGSERLCHGGCFMSNAYSCKIGSRLAFSPSRRNSFVGFRIARSSK